MKMALLGATGFVNSALLGEALHRGHKVTAIIRHPEKLAKQDGLLAMRGDVYDPALLATLLRGNDAVISAFNPGWENSNLYDDQVRGTTSIIAAVKIAGIRRVLWVGGAGGLEVKPGVRTGKFRLGRDQLLVDSNGQSRISVQDYAVAMIDELENPHYIRQRFTAGY